MTRAIFFDMGGTLDGERHWLERFLVFYEEVGLRLPREKIRGAFDAAESRAATEAAMAEADLSVMIRLHVKWQLAHLQLSHESFGEELAERFIGSVIEAAEANRLLLAELVEAGFRLGVVSNGCGNVKKLCASLGYTSFLSVIVDSHRVRLSKPDPAIYTYAAEAIAEAPENILMVGDSFERDIRPAKTVGMKTAWLQDGETCPDPALVDFRLDNLSQLPAFLNEPAGVMV